MLYVTNLLGLAVSTTSATHRYWQAIKTNVATGGNTNEELRLKDISGTQITVTSGMLSQSGLAAFNAANTVDGNTATAAFNTDTSGIGSYLRVDFGAGNEKEVHTWEMYVNGSTPATWDIQYSDDASSWTTVYTGLSQLGAAGYKTATW